MSAVDADVVGFEEVRPEQTLVLHSGPLEAVLRAGMKCKSELCSPMDAAAFKKYAGRQQGSSPIPGGWEMMPRGFISPIKRVWGHADRREECSMGNQIGRS